MKPHSGFRSVEKSLSAREREALPVSKFALPSQKAKIDSKAHAVLKKSGRS